MLFQLSKNSILIGDGELPTLYEIISNIENTYYECVVIVKLYRGVLYTYFLVLELTKFSK